MRDFPLNLKDLNDNNTEEALGLTRKFWNIEIYNADEVVQGCSTTRI